MEQDRENIRKLMIAANRIEGLYYLVSRKLGAKYNTFALLYALADGQQYSQKQICDDWLIPRTTLNTIVKECVANGYVALTAMGNKKKAVSLTESGKQYADHILKSITDAEMTAMRKTAEVFSDEFVSAFEHFAENLNESFTQILENEVIP